MRLLPESSLERWKKEATSPPIKKEVRHGEIGRTEKDVKVLQVRGDTDATRRRITLNRGG